MKREIPAQSLVICDGCGITCDRENRKRDYALVQTRELLDHLGCRYAQDSVAWDFCDKCSIAVEESILEAIKYLKRK